MMQATHPWQLDDLPMFGRLDWPWDWTVVRKRSVWADAMVILEIGFETAPELLFMEHDHSIQAFSPDGTDEERPARCYDDCGALFEA